jgi:threonine 3-dehydrogenase
MPTPQDQILGVDTDWYKAARFLQAGLLDPSPIVTLRFPLAEFDQAMHLIAHGECGKIILLP